MTRKSVGQFLTFKFVGRKCDISGIVLDYNNDYTLVRRCYDYLLDGFTIFKNEKVDYLYGDFEKRATKILKLKSYSFNDHPKIVLESLDKILESISKKYSLIQLDTKKGDASDVVKYLGKVDRLYVFDELTVEAKWRYKLKLSEKECRFISFDNDYLNSLNLIAKSK